MIFLEKEENHVRTGKAICLSHIQLDAREFRCGTIMNCSIVYQGLVDPESGKTARRPSDDQPEQLILRNFGHVHVTRNGRIEMMERSGRGKALAKDTVHHVSYAHALYGIVPAGNRARGCLDGRDAAESRNPAYARGEARKTIRRQCAGAENEQTPEHTTAHHGVLGPWEQSFWGRSKRCNMGGGVGGNEMKLPHVCTPSGATTTRSLEFKSYVTKLKQSGNSAISPVRVRGGYERESASARQLCMDALGMLQNIPDRRDCLNFLYTAIQYTLNLRSPPTKAKRVHSPVGSPDFRKWESCRTMSLVSGFFGDIPFPQPLHSGAAPYSLQSPSLALRTSLLRVAQISSLTTIQKNRSEDAEFFVPDKNLNLRNLLVKFCMIMCDCFPAKVWRGQQRDCVEQDANHYLYYTHVPFVRPSVANVLPATTIQEAYKGSAYRLTYDLTNTHTLPGIRTHNLPHPRPAVHEPTALREVRSGTTSGLQVLPTTPDRNRSRQTVWCLCTASAGENSLWVDNLQLHSPATCRNAFLLPNQPIGNISQQAVASQSDKTSPS
ncbi:hypothetical protein PR048_029189 [Dryococelus australis]|uniref:Uncharacterized protein n=1 Tax=Dryococelus australis TaxID=614101 RepID=A0ABQ9GCN7_9NEOP|nr:hypothetical protein PR048_029189 [Dryococelus australis]